MFQIKQIILILFVITVSVLYYTKIKFTATTNPDGTICSGNDPNSIYSYQGGICSLSNCKQNYTFDGSSCKLKKSGDTCPGPDSNSIYTYDSAFNCNLTGCITGYAKNFGTCYPVGSDCNALGLVATPLPNTTYTLNTTGQCILGCSEFYKQNSDKSCSYRLQGSCSPSTNIDQNGVYMYDLNGNCTINSCSFGYMLQNNTCVLDPSRKFPIHVGDVATSFFDQPFVTTSQLKNGGAVGGD